MANIHRGATLAPGFRDFLPAWLASRTWYAGDDVPTPELVGAFRFEDPAGEVGLETHLVRAGGVLYQLPMTYRGAPIASPGLITTAEHSVLGTRWIYDAEHDPLWHELVRTTVRDGGVSHGAGRSRAAEARGERLADVPADARVELHRRPADHPAGPDAVGRLLGTWSGGAGVLATLRA
ncbi:maltokinase N-terminal cap-like domain-containing protein [Saccharothrix obliqua]|uniref:maltokinase N-terminal cap-like domain-containing protein n=1 Tax=Saccharothrix obliqua TaxID=2861747 RepID=UPI001C5F4EA3|nr:hypothetical protein [Saccharothrix obliqua]MBW4720698.1 hypothetical protein [Saccharothrix obliqua]